MKKILACALLTGLIGCGTDTPAGPETLPDLEVPPVPQNGVQILTAIAEDIQPGMDYEYCAWTDVILDHDVDVRSTLGYQNEPPGHHSIVYYTTEKQPPGTQRVCTDTDMASFRFLAGNAGTGILNEAPGNLVYRLPAGAQIVINAHYLNAGDTVLRGQSVVNLNFAEPGNYIPSGSTAFLDTAIHVQPGVSTFDTTCTVDRQLKVWRFAPHMHRWGTNIKVDLIQNGESERLFDQNWEPHFTFNPPDMRFDPSAPRMLNPGDQMKVHCEWNNDTGRVLDFGFEMCVAFGQFVDDTGMGNWACDANSWVNF